MPDRRPSREERLRLRLDLTGALQGVGFRPFVHRLAAAAGLGGFVRNTGDGVTLEIEGTPAVVDGFLARLEIELPPPAAIEGRRVAPVAPQGQAGFRIAPSDERGAQAVVLPDLATCPDCLGEILDASDRRFRYPFTTCVRCGPRYSIIETVPWDRERTTMRRFPMCVRCQAEYDDPRSRRFHAETNACPDCGPRIALWNAEGRSLAEGDAALCAAADAIRQGRIVALKGLGGFQLLADARNEKAVEELRERKRRPAKPFAVMVESLGAAREIALIADEEARLLSSPAAPIVLSRGHGKALAPGVAPGNPLCGVMLPYTPLHHLLMRDLGFPIVATSGNRGDEPIVTEDHEALDRLAGIADLFLVHDRPILRRVDDSILRVVAGQAVVLRCARGHAPHRLATSGAAVPAVAVGGHQKNSIAVAVRDRIVLGPHIGDLTSAAARAAFAHTLEGLTSLHRLAPGAVACDEHPDYHSTQVALRRHPEARRVPHHLAHVLAGMVDNGLDGPVLGVAWDGTGFGRDGVVRGGEFIAVEGDRYRRVGHLMPFRLPGGEAAAREPRRSALGVLYRLLGDEVLGRTDLAPVASFEPGARSVLKTMLMHGVNAPWTTSAGRLFDAVAAILGLRQTASFEGEAAAAVEFAADGAIAHPLPAPGSAPDDSGRLVVDWRPALQALVDAASNGVAAATLARGFHEALAAAIVGVARQVGIEAVLLTGGCFQNALLTELAAASLRVAGFRPFWHHSVPPNDGGLAVGQAAFAVRPLAEGGE